MRYTIFSLLFILTLQTQVFSQSYNNVLFMGRFDFTNPSVPTFSHVSTSIKANFTGTGISIDLSSEYGTSFFQVIIDGNDNIEERKQVSISSKTTKNIVLASGLSDGNHTVEIVKTNQWDTKVAFHGFTVEGGELLEKPAESDLKIEFYGDSNPAGHSAWDPFDWGALKDNGGYYTYPGITARMLNAECVNISMGGAGVTNKAWRNLVDYHDLINMEDPATGSNLWDFSDNHISDEPDAVVINLGANDYYGPATKAEIKTGWKDFITKDLRNYYPNAHIVLANSYGWAVNEPADYVNDAIDELVAAGEANVSYVKFPWLWGQEHAVVNEHAGFANILAVHLANKLGLPEPEKNSLSSFVAPGEIFNGSFEITSIPGYADGWRPHGDNVSLQTVVADAHDGENVLRIENMSWAHFATEAKEGDRIAVSAFIRKVGAGNNLGKLKLEFKDQGQNTIATNEGLFGAQDEWRETTNIAVAPAGTWSVWIVLVAEENSIIEFDNVLIIDNNTSNTNKALMSSDNLILYPNPCNGKNLYIENKEQMEGEISIINSTGILIDYFKLHNNHLQVINFKENLNSGIYSIVLHTGKQTITKQIVVK